jgi:hypothetical protein
VIATDLDTLLIALYVELTDRIIPSSGNAGRRLGRPPEVTDAELACLAAPDVTHGEPAWRLAWRATGVSAVLALSRVSFAHRGVPV